MKTIESWVGSAIRILTVAGSVLASPLAAADGTGTVIGLASYQNQWLGLSEAGKETRTGISSRLVLRATIKVLASVDLGSRLECQATERIQEGGLVLDCENVEQQNVAWFNMDRLNCGMFFPDLDCFSREWQSGGLDRRGVRALLLERPNGCRPLLEDGCDLDKEPRTPFIDMSMPGSLHGAAGTVMRVPEAAAYLVSEEEVDAAHPFFFGLGTSFGE